jgi:hypothetical protein
MASRPDERRFYVYVIFRLDASPCYIGKGQGRRWLQHEADAIAGRHANRRLVRLIKEAAAIGKKLPRIKLRENLTNAEACKTEIALIAAIGRGRHGPLMNLTDGGEGIVGRAPLSKEARRRIGLGGEKRRGRNTGPRPPEWRAAISASKIGQPSHPNTIAAAIINFSGPKSEKHRKAIGAALEVSLSTPEGHLLCVDRAKRGWERRRKNGNTSNNGWETRRRRDAEIAMNEQWKLYQLTYIKRDLGVTGTAALALLRKRARAARYVQQFTKARQAANAKDVAWDDFEKGAA